MTTAKIKKILSCIGADIDEVFQPAGIRAVIMPSNFSVDYLRDRFYFDSDDNILKIKQFTYKKKSGLISEKSTLDETKKILTCKDWFLYSTPTWPGKCYELVLISKNNPSANPTAIYTIKSNGRGFVEVNEPISQNLNNFYIVYLTESSERLVRDSYFPLDYYEMKELTNNKYDIYLDSESIIGFETNSNILGSV